MVSGILVSEIISLATWLISSGLPLSLQFMRSGMEVPGRTDPAKQGFYAAAIVNNHSALNYQELAGRSLCIVDTHNAMAGSDPVREVGKA